MIQLNSIETEVLQMLLDGDDSVLGVLRKQLTGLAVKNRDFTGVGFFTSFDHPKDVQRIPNEKPIRFGDVQASIEGLQNGAGFLLFVDDGRLSSLEGYTYDEEWPRDPIVTNLSYVDGQRDLKKLQSSWA